MSASGRSLTVIFGGAFDPVHFGHIKPVMELAKRPEIGQIRFLPCCGHPLKQLGETVVHRVAMLKQIIRPPRIVLDTRDLDRGGTSYTIDVRRELRAELGDEAPLAFMLGQDAFLKITGWKRYDKLLEFAHFIVTARPHYRVPDDHCFLRRCSGWSPLSELTRTPAGRLFLLRDPLVSVSSTDVRACLERREQPRYLMPGSVWSYIRRHKLYGYGIDAA